VKAAITCVLCSGADRGFTSLPPPATRHGVVGLFSQLNHFVQELLVRIYRGEPPRSLQALYESTRLVGYGGGTIGDHFELGFTCSSSPRALDSVAEATKLLRRTPRYHVVGALLHLALVPKRPLTLAPVRVHVSADVRFDLAVHVRRGDRLWVGQRVEQIDVWSEQALLRKILDALNKPAFTAIGTSTEKKRVLLASDDNEYLERIAALARGAGLDTVTFGNSHEQLDDRNRSMEAARVCGAECLPELLSMLSPFGRADRLMLSTKSNVGVFLLSWWSAANGGRAAPTAVCDLDGILHQESLPSRYFCELQWGIRHGMCSGPQSTCDLPQMAKRTFCGGTG